VGQITLRLKEGAQAIGMLAPIPATTPPTGGGGGNSITSNSNNNNSNSGGMPAPNLSTDGIDMEEWDPLGDGDDNSGPAGSQHVSFTIWDFAGQEVCTTNKT
jgi:hypothetical protein